VAAAEALPRVEGRAMSDAQTVLVIGGGTGIGRVRPWLK
jgi:hypothetical protein